MKTIGNAPVIASAMRRTTVDPAAAHEVVQEHEPQHADRRC